MSTNGFINLINTILIVEDDIELAELIRKKMVREGFKVDIEPSGKKALKYIANKKNILMLLDYELKDITGYELIKEMNSKKIYTPFIVITGYEDVYKAVNMMKYGAKDYIIKDMNFVKLLPSIIKKVLEEIEFEKKLKKVEKAHRESEKRFQVLFDTTQELIAILDLSWDTIWFNPSWHKKFGYSLNNHGNVINRIHPDDRELLLKNWGLILEKKASFLSNINIRYEKHDGTYVLLEATIKKLSIGNKEYIYFVAHDITKKKEMEKALIESEQLFKTIYEKSPIAIMLFDKKGKILDANRASLNLFGIEDINDARDFNLFDDPFLTDTIKNKLFNNQSVFYENEYNFELIIKKGLYKTYKTDNIYIKVSITPLQFNKIPSGFLVQVIDITERKIIEDELKESEDRYRRITNAITDYIYTVKIKEGKPVETMHGNGCYYITGYKKEEFIENPYLWIQMVHEDDIKRVEDQINNILNCSKIESIIHRIIKKDGSVHWVQNTPVPKYDTNGNLIYYDGIIRDITVIKNAEEEIHKLNEELENRVEIRTKQLEESNKNLESFAYSVSHDLRAPLRHIVGFTELLKKEISVYMAVNNNEKVDKYINNIIDSAKNMDTLINDLLSFSRTAYIKINFSDINLNNLISEVIELLEDEISNRVITWDVNSLPNIKGDLAMLRQVFINLLSNSIKYTRTKKKAVIKIDIKESNNEENVFYIKDNGVGFDMKYQKKLFGVFQRFHSSEEFEGSGIGLAIVKQIITRHNGKIWVESNINKGSTFYFSIPKNI